MGHYIKNLETSKLELHFDKPEYLALPDELKKEIRSTCLFSKYAGAWVSRSKNNHYRAIQLANKLGLENRGEEGEKISFGEQIERKQERAGNRADRFDGYLSNSKKKQAAYQAEFNKMRKDWAFITQPNINTSAGRAFTNQRNKIVARYEKGFREMDKQNYFNDRAAAAEHTAEGKQYENAGFLGRRIKESEARIRALQREIDPYEAVLKAGEEKRYIDNKYVMVALSDDLKVKYASRCLQYFEKMEDETDKLNFYKEKLDAIGGLAHTKESMKEQKATHLDYRGKTYPVKSLNAKSVTVLNWLQIATWTWNVPYGEIKNTYAANDLKVVFDRDGNEVKPKIKY